MPIYMDLKGKQFGRLKVLGFSHSDSKSRFWICKCECGKKVIKRTSGLVSSRVRSCGCLKRWVKGGKLEGKQRGQVHIIKDTGKSTKRGRIIYLCKCLVCGKLFENKVRKNIKSCGCLRFRNLKSYQGQKRHRKGVFKFREIRQAEGKSMNTYFQDRSPCCGCQSANQDKELCSQDCILLAKYQQKVVIGF